MHTIAFIEKEVHANITLDPHLTTVPQIQRVYVAGRHPPNPTVLEHENSRFCETCKRHFEQHDPRYGEINHFCRFCGDRLVDAFHHYVISRLGNANIPARRNAGLPPQAGGSAPSSRSPHVRFQGMDIPRSYSPVPRSPSPPRHSRSPTVGVERINIWRPYSPIPRSPLLSPPFGNPSSPDSYLPSGLGRPDLHQVPSPPTRCGGEAQGANASRGPVLPPTDQKVADSWKSKEINKSERKKRNTERRLRKKQRRKSREKK